MGGNIQLVEGDRSNGKQNQTGVNIRFIRHRTSNGKIAAQDEIQQKKKIVKKETI